MKKFKVAVLIILSLVLMVALVGCKKKIDPKNPIQKISEDPNKPAKEDETKDKDQKMYDKAVKMLNNKKIVAAQLDSKGKATGFIKQYINGKFFKEIDTRMPEMTKYRNLQTNKYYKKNSEGKFDEFTAEDFEKYPEEFGEINFESFINSLKKVFPIIDELYKKSKQARIFNNDKKEFVIDFYSTFYGDNNIVERNFNTVLTSKHAKSIATVTKLVVSEKEISVTYSQFGYLNSLNEYVEDDKTNMTTLTLYTDDFSEEYPV